MKIYLSFFLLILIHCSQVFAQQQNPKTQAELEERMKAAQKELDKLSPDQKKIMEQMGLLPQAIPQGAPVSDKQVSDATGGSTVPEKDLQKINSIDNSPLTESTLPAFLSTTHNFVVTKLKPASKTTGENIYNKLKDDGKTAFVIGNSAAGLWIMGRIEPALYVMGKACMMDAENTDNLNNYAAMLTMCSAENYAIPILNYLNAQFPKNTTILNNLGQAWFGLGEIPKAEKYLDSTLAIYSYHPQANYTKSFIEESRGNTDKAIESVKKSIKQSYSQDKQNRLSKLGYKLQWYDISFPLKPDSDPMGLNSFKLPQMPQTAGQEAFLMEEWTSTNDRLAALGNSINQQKQALLGPKQKTMIENAQKYLDKPNAPKSTKSVPDRPLFSKKAELKLKELDKDGGVEFRYTKSLKELKLYISKLQSKKEEFHKELAALNLKEAHQTGEGTSNKSFCPEYIALISKYLAEYNNEYEKICFDYLHQSRLKLNDEIYWLQFKENPEEFENTKLSYRLKWLQALTTVSSGRFQSEVDLADCLAEKEAIEVGGKLANFNDINCQYHSELNLVVGTITIDCNKMVTNFEMGFLKLGLTQDMDQETFGDQFKSCNVEFTAKAGSGSVKMGPVSLGVNASVGVGIVIGRAGVQDLYLTGKVEAEAGTNALGELAKEKEMTTSMAGIGVSDKSYNAGVAGRISILSGKTSGEVTGLFK